MSNKNDILKVRKRKNNNSLILKPIKIFLNYGYTQVPF